MLFLSEKSISKTQMFGQQGGCNKTGFLIACVFLCEKLAVFWAPFLAKFELMFEKHCKNRYFSTFPKAKQRQNDHFEGLLSGPSKGYYLGQVCCNIQMANLAQIITLQMFAHTVSLNVLKPLCL